jgi:hypothetical protein
MKLPRLGARPVEVGVFAAAIMVLVTSGARRLRHAASFRSDAGDVQLNASGDIRLSTTGALFEIVGRPGAGEELGDIRIVRDARGVVFENIALGALVDGAPARLVADKPRTTPAGPAHAVANVELRGQGGTLDADLGYTLRRSPASLVVSLKMRSAQPHSVALVMNVPTREAVPFVRGTGMLVDSGDAQGPLVVFESARGAAAVGSTQGDVAVHVGPSEEIPESPLSATITLPAGPPGEASPLFIVTGHGPGGAVEAAARLRNEPVRRLHGRVVGGDTGVDVWGVGPDGRPLLHAKPDAEGTFEAVAPPIDVGFYATMAHTRASPIVPRGAKDDSELELTMLPGGEAHVRVEDADTGQPLTARLIVHGVAPTADPNFGPDYRASGAGPLIDALRGDATMPLPTGRYRILATRGPEYTIDEQGVDVAPGSSHPVRLLLRHVVDTPGWVGCDFHVHARPSFDSPVLPEDRVISLIAAGIDFAVPSEHNAVGHYEPVLEALELQRDLSTVPGVEITTARPNFGHFNVFPYAGPQVPPFRRTTVKKIFLAAREGDPSRVLQVNHPRLKTIGYFDIVGLDTKTGHADRDWRDDFDSLEVYNGADGANRARVEAVLFDWLRLLELGHKYVGTGDSDSHRIQYQWAGYPRTYVALPLDQAGDTGAPIDKVALVASLKAGHAFVTSGPILEATINGQGPGGKVVLPEAVAHLHVVVRAAPWIDVSEVEVLLGTAPVARVPVPSRPRPSAPPDRDLAGARAAALRFERNFDVPFEGTAPKFVVVVVRGTRAIDDVLPYMPIQPLAFTNPIWLERP